MSAQEKTTAKHSKKVVEVQSKHNYENAFLWLEKWGKKQYGEGFKLHEEDKPVLLKLLSYFLKDEAVASQLQINLHKGILLNGPVGCGKSTLMNLLRLFEPMQNRFIIKTCRDVSFEFIKEGYETIHKYSRYSFYPNTHANKTYCFDDLGTESVLKYFGNDCNVLSEVLLSRYDLFISRQLITHITTNLSASEIEDVYGNRVRSRIREMCNLISFAEESVDKRK